MKYLYRNQNGRKTRVQAKDFTELMDKIEDKYRGSRVVCVDTKEVINLPFKKYE
jgi:hypothetical protein